MAIGNLPEKEFRMMIVKMIQDLRKSMKAKIEKMQEMFTKDLQELKNKQMNNTLERINTRITEAEEQTKGGQNGGNHCCRTEYRKKNENK